MLSKYKSENKSLFSEYNNSFNKIYDNIDTYLHLYMYLYVSICIFICIFIYIFICIYDNIDNIDKDTDKDVDRNTNKNTNVDSNVDTEDSDMNTINEFASNYAEQIIQWAVEKNVEHAIYTEKYIATIVQAAKNADFAAKVVQMAQDADFAAKVVQMAQDADFAAKVVQMAQDADFAAKVVQMAQDADVATKVVQMAQDANLERFSEIGDTTNEITEDAEDAEDVKNENAEDGNLTPIVNRLCFTLGIETTNTSPQKGCLANRFEEPDSEIISMGIGDITCLDDIPEDQNLYDMVSYFGNEITFEKTWESTKDNTIVANNKKTYTNNKGYFTVEELVDCIVDFEKIDRSSCKSWFGGVDCHHVFFEGVDYDKEKNIYNSSWGS
jgi:hypothetical protein